MKYIRRQNNNPGTHNNIKEELLTMGKYNILLQEIELIMRNET